MKKALGSVMAVLIGTCIASAQGQTQFSGWLASFNTVKLGNKLSLHADMQWRSSDELKHTQALLLRPGLNVHLNKQLIATAGYAFIYGRRVVSGISGYAPEHRIWEQLIYNHKAGPVFVSHRLRAEQRFISVSSIQGNELKNEHSVTAHRLRYFIRNLLPLQPGPAFKTGIFTALQNEIFVNTGNLDNVNGKLFDQNRLYIAIGYRLHPSFDLEAGYMNQYINGKSDNFTNNHIVQLAGYLRM